MGYGNTLTFLGIHLNEIKRDAQIHSLLLHQSRNNYTLIRFGMDEIDTCLPAVQIQYYWVAMAIYWV